jgi:hypothetical protein
MTPADRTGQADELNGPEDAPGGRQPGPTGTPADDETDRTDLDMDEPFEGFGVGGTARELSRDEALRALGGEDDAA